MQDDIFIDDQTNNRAKGAEDPYGALFEEESANIDQKRQRKKRRRPKTQSNMPAFVLVFFLIILIGGVLFVLSYEAPSPVKIKSKVAVFPIAVSKKNQIKSPQKVFPKRKSEKKPKQQTEKHSESIKKESSKTILVLTDDLEQQGEQILKEEPVSEESGMDEFEMASESYLEKSMHKEKQMDQEKKDDQTVLLLVQKDENSKKTTLSVTEDTTDDQEISKTIVIMEGSNIRVKPNKTNVETKIKKNKTTSRREPGESVKVQQNEKHNAIQPYVIPKLADLIKRGSFQQAATRYHNALKRYPKAYSLRLEVVCQGNSIRTAYQEGHFDPNLFVLPKKLGEKSCFAIFWGLFVSQKEAEAAISSIPVFFSKQKYPPAPTPLRQYL